MIKAIYGTKNQKSKIKNPGNKKNHFDLCLTIGVKNRWKSIGYLHISMGIRNTCRNICIYPRFTFFIYIHTYIVVCMLICIYVDYSLYGFSHSCVSVVTEKLLIQK